MKRVWKWAGIALLVAILGVGAVGAVALAQDDGSGGPFDFGQRFCEALAGILGISVEEYDAAVEKAQGQVIDEAVAEGWLTEDQAEMMRWRMAQEPGPGKGLPAFGPGMGGPGPGPKDNLLSIAADQLDLSLTELLTELQDGKSIADLAAEKGVDTQTIVDAYLAQVQEDLDEAVAEGRMTQKQADYALQQAGQRVTDRLDNTRPQDFPGGGHRNEMRGFPGTDGL